MKLDNQNHENKELYLTYYNIRHSISVLLFKIVLIDFLAGAFHVSIYFALVKGEHFMNYTFTDNPISLLVYAIIIASQVFLTSYIVLQWLNEYYEITPDEIVHKNGIIFKKIDKYRFDNVRAISISENFIGELLNLGTITLYDIRMQKYLDMYLIHNPRRYFKVIKAMKPNIEYKKEETIVPLLTKDEEVGEND